MFGIFRNNDRDTLESIYSKINDANLNAISNRKYMQLQHDMIDCQRNIIRSLLDVLCEKYANQTLIIGFGKDVCPLVVQNGKRVTEDMLKSVSYRWTKNKSESLHVEYEK